VVIPLGNLNSSPFSIAYGQEANDQDQDEEEGSTESTQSEVSEEDADQQDQEDEGSTTESTESEVSEEVALRDLQGIAELAGVTNWTGIGSIIQAENPDELAQVAGEPDSEALVATPEVSDSDAVDAIAGADDVPQLSQVVGVPIQDLLKNVLPEQPAEDPGTEEPGAEDPGTEEPGAEDPGTEEPGAEDPGTELTAEIQASVTDGQAPLTVELDAIAEGGTEPWAYSWDFESDGTEDSTEQTVEHTFEDPDLYTVTLTVTDADQQEATDTVEINATEATAPPSEEPGTETPGAEGPGGEISELYPTADGGPTWKILEQEDPTEDGYFYYGMYRTTTIDYLGDGVWEVNAESGTQEHGIRMHVDSPSGEWKNTEMTGYFMALTGDDQFTMIARHGPSYHDNNGCDAYGYYGMTAVDGNVFFKKKLYHFNNGYTKRLAQIDALDDVMNKWIGMKFVVYDLPNGDVKLELYVDENANNNWQKVTELVDEGNLAVEGGDDCGRDATDKIPSGTRASFRVDNMKFQFSDLSVREIEP
jgi:PKD repeat protein